MAASRDPNQAAKPDLRELGVSGTRIWAGLLSEETVPQLQGMNAYKSYQGMRFDATCSALLKAIELPIRSARWYVAPASENPDDVNLADYVHDNLWEFGTQSFDDIMRLANLCLAFGFQPLEILYSYIDQGPWTGKIGWEEFSYRSAATKWRWNMNWIGGRRRLESMTQLSPPFYQAIDIPASKLLIFTNDKEGDNLDGWSLLRPAWKDYVLRDRLYRIRGIGLERQYMGIPVATLPPEYGDDLRDLAKQIVQTLRVDEQAGVIKPESLILEMLHSKVNGREMDSAILYHNRQILLSQLAQFLDLGSGQAGAYSLSSDHSELFLYAIDAKANYMAEVINLDPGIPSLLRFNFPNVEKTSLPKLEHGDIGQRSLDKLGRTLQALGQWGFITPDDATEDRLRQMLDLPEREDTISEDALRDLVQRVFPVSPEPGRTHTGQRAIAPGLSTGAAAAMGLVAAPGASSGGSAPSGSSAPKGGSSSSSSDGASMAEYIRASEAKQQLAEVLVRRKWDRPKGRLGEPERRAVMATEAFTEALEEFRGGRGVKPPKPSVALARHRRPYVVRSAEEGAPRRVGSNQERTVHTRQMALARRHSSALEHVLRPKVTVSSRPTEEG